MMGDFINPGDFEKIKPGDVVGDPIAKDGSFRKTGIVIDQAGIVMLDIMWSNGACEIWSRKGLNLLRAC
jgi:hypothetical protein